MIGLIAAIVLGGLFGSASASVVSIDDEVMVIELEVEVMATGGTVVAHLTFDDDQPLTLPLIERDGDTYGLTTELEPKNYLVVFEIVDEESTSPVSLADLGADLLPESAGTTTTTEDGMTEETQRSLWLAVALAAGSLAVLAFWVLGGRSEADEETTDDPADEEE